VTGAKYLKSLQSCNTGTNFNARFVCGHNRTTEENGIDFLDRRVKFDFYLRRSDGKFQLFIDGVRQNNFNGAGGSQLQFVSNLSFPAVNDIEIVLAHATYHLDSDKKALQADHNSTFDYYIDHNYRMDERHWSDVGYEEVGAFPV